MFINEIWDFKSINMAHELGIAGEFIYDSARKAMALRNLYNDYELNSILYNGAVGIERLQKIYLCLSIPNPMDKSTVPECLKKHNHNELEKHVKEYSGKCISANGRSLLGLFSEYYNNYRYANYVPGYNSKKLKSLFIGFLKKQNGKFDFEELCTAVQFEPFKRYYINELGKTANYYYSLIDEKAREIGTYTYELDSYSNASRVFWSTQRRSLYKQLILEQEAVKELLIHLYKDHGDSGVLKLFNEMHSLEFDDALINDYLADLCEGTTKVGDKESYYSVDTIKGFIAPRWTLEYCLALSALASDFHKAIHYAKKIKNSDKYSLTVDKIQSENRMVETEQSEWKQFSNEEKAYKIFQLMLDESNKSGLKAIVAQCLASMLKWKYVEKTDDLTEENMFDLDLYQYRILEDERIKLKEIIENDPYINYLAKAIRYAVGLEV